MTTPTAQLAPFPSAYQPGERLNITDAPEALEPYLPSVFEHKAPIEALGKLCRQAANGSDAAEKRLNNLDGRMDADMAPAQFAVYKAQPYRLERFKPVALLMSAYRWASDSRSGYIVAQSGGGQDQNEIYYHRFNRRTAHLIDDRAQEYRGLGYGEINPQPSDRTGPVVSLLLALQKSRGLARRLERGQSIIPPARQLQPTDPFFVSYKRGLLPASMTPERAVRNLSRTAREARLAKASLGITKLAVGRKWGNLRTWGGLIKESPALALTREYSSEIIRYQQANLGRAGRRPKMRELMAYIAAQQTDAERLGATALAAILTRRSKPMEPRSPAQNANWLQQRWVKTGNFLRKWAQRGVDFLSMPRSFSYRSMSRHLAASGVISGPQAPSPAWIGKLTQRLNIQSSVNRYVGQRLVRRAEIRERRPRTAQLIRTIQLRHDR